jgi:hypothetical protein
MAAGCYNEPNITGELAGAPKILRNVALASRCDVKDAQGIMRHSRASTTQDVSAAGAGVAEAVGFEAY